MDMKPDSEGKVTEVRVCDSPPICGDLGIPLKVDNPLPTLYIPTLCLE